MKNKFHDLERKIRSLPEPDYDKKFSKETQNTIHENLLQLASSFDKKKKRSGRLMKRISIGLASLAAFVLFAVLTIPFIGDKPSSTGSNKQGHQNNKVTTIDKNKGKNDKDANNQTKTDNKLTKNILYENTEYGFSFTLPKSWEGYKVLTDSWDGISSDQQNKLIEHGKILSIRHPDWTEEKPRQDIPIMIFTLNQWSSLSKGEFHIGAAPVGPTMLGQNNEYVFALPARYNFAFPEGYQEVENILENQPLQPKNIGSDQK
ncbi:hypothetical protein [Neobacillus terrae]|uniref:hypothetical protein n=1 Tax=Neobacillus terrae TaxID=3034837 RepID=UPI00140AD271|nr:hypothetical protein [Neobacillus terrae]NHM30043.1 hypothetical protein [Neobacillus terrae]